VSVHVIGPTKLPEKITPWCIRGLQQPVTMKLEPTLEKVALLPGIPLALQPERQAPVVKLTEPSACPAPAVIPLKECSWECMELIPAALIEIEPNWLVRSIPFAQAAIGKTNAISANTTTRLILLFPPRTILYFSWTQHLGHKHLGHKGRCRYHCTSDSKTKQSAILLFINNLLIHYRCRDRRLLQSHAH